MRGIAYLISILGYLRIPLLARAVDGLDIAMIDVVLVENNAGKYTTLTYHVKGRFSRAGAITSAEGDILQLHGKKVCSNNLNMKGNHEYGWVGVMKFPPAKSPQKPCISIIRKAEIAVQRGATAVIFDVTDNPDARKELEAKSGVVLRPVVIVEGQDARRLGNLLQKRKLSRARINNVVKKITQETSNEYFDMGIFMAFFILVSLICLALLIKIKWRQKRKQTSLTRMALQAISRMETRKFRAVQSRDCSFSESTQSINSVYSCNRWPYYNIRSCAICLDEFFEGQDIRIVPCRHEFHKACVDPWLLSNCTCPLCMLNIVEPLSKKKKPRVLRRPSRTWWARCCLARVCFSGDMESREGNVEETSIQEQLPLPLDDLNIHDIYPDESAYSSRIRVCNENALPEQNTSQSEVNSGHSRVPGVQNTDYFQPYKLHRCKFHHKKNRQRNMIPLQVNSLDSNIEHSIVVVANLPVDNFEKMQEDVV